MLTNDIMSFQETDTLDVAYGALELVSVIVGLLLNTLTIPYFYRNKVRLSSFLYLLIVVTDILSLITTFPSAFSMLHDRDGMLLSNHFICSCTGFLFNITARLSVFLIALLGVERAMTLFFPFKRLHHMKRYICAVSIYLVINIMLASLPLIFSSLGYYYLQVVGQCSWGVSDLTFVKTGSSALWQGITYSTIILPWLVPGVVVMASCTTSIFVLIRSEKKRRRMLGRNFIRRSVATNRTKYVSMTILIMTLVYIAFNVPCWLFYIYLILNRFNPVAWLTARTAIYIHIFVSRLSVSMNAACNPIVYFCRIGELRKFSRRKVSLSNSLAMIDLPNAMRINTIANIRSRNYLDCDNSKLNLHGSLQSMRFQGSSLIRKSEPNIQSLEMLVRRTDGQFKDATL